MLQYVGRFVFAVLPVDTLFPDLFAFAVEFCSWLGKQVHDLYPSICRTGVSLSVLELSDLTPDFRLCSEV